MIASDPIISAQVRNNGNAPAITPVVELVTSLAGFPPASGFWVTMGAAPVGPLYPHQSTSVSVAWDWSRVPSSDLQLAAFNFRAVCYDPILDPRPDLDTVADGQSPHHTKVVTLQSLPL